MNRRFFYTVLTIIFISLGTAVAVFFAKGYRYSPATSQVNGTGIISITTIPDQASVYIDGHLTTASNANISSLPPKTYDIQINKEGFIPWDKKVVVKEGLVTQIKATLFPAIPTVYPLTYNGVGQVNLSPDGQRIVFIVTAEEQTDQQLSPSLRKSGIWVWEMLGNPLNFAGGPEPHRVADLTPGLDYTKATIRWSPDSSQFIVNLSDRSLLLSENKFNDFGQDITAQLQPTLDSWNQQQKQQDQTNLATIKDLNLRAEASSAASLKWSPDETKFIYSASGKDNFKLVDLTSKSIINLDNPTSVSWLADSRHLVEAEAQNQTQSESSQFPLVKISVMEVDGSNKSEIYVGNLDPKSVFPWPDSSRLVFVSSLPTPTAQKPNLFGVNLK